MTKSKHGTYAFNFTPTEYKLAGQKAAMLLRDPSNDTLGVLSEMKDGTYVFWRHGEPRTFRKLADVFEHACGLPVI